MLKTFDYILIILLLIFAFTFNFIFTKTNKSKSSDVLVVTLDGEEVETHPLGEDGNFVFENKGKINKFKIADGYVTMIEANCPDRYCLNTAPIYYNSQTIVCLPNKVVLEIKSEDEEKQTEIDSLLQ